MRSTKIMNKLIKQTMFKAKEKKLLQKISQYNKKYKKRMKLNKNHK